MPTPIAVLLVEGHPRVREALARALRRAPGIGPVHEAGTLQDGVLMAREHAPRVAICDPRTVGGDSAAVVRQLRPEVRHVVVLAASLLDHERQALAASASAVLLKG